MRDFARELAGKLKLRRRKIEPAPDCVRGRLAVKGGINFHSREKTRIEFEPVRFGKLSRVEDLTPFVEIPRASADADFLLLVQVQFGDVGVIAGIGT